MRVLSYLMTIIGIAMVFIFGSGVDSGGKTTIWCCIGVVVGLGLVLIGFMTGKGFAEDEEDDF